MATLIGKVGMVMKGEWDSANTYEALDTVTYNGALYTAKQYTPANTAPTNTTYWQSAADFAAALKSKHFFNYGKYIEVDISDYLSNLSNAYTTQVLLYSYGGAGGVNNESYGYLSLVNTMALYNSQPIEYANLVLKNGSAVTVEYNSTTHVIKMSIDSTYNFYFGAIIL